MLMHKDLLCELTNNQLRRQWQELSKNCGLILIEKKSSVFQILLITEHGGGSHLWSYAQLVKQDLARRGIQCTHKVTCKIKEACMALLHGNEKLHNIGYKELFAGWHNERYLVQCLHSLQTRVDAGVMDKEAWYQIQSKYFIYVNY